MASIRKIEGKHGTTYKITVTLGRDSLDRQIRHYKTWKPEKPMSARELNRELQRLLRRWVKDGTIKPVNGSYTFTLINLDELERFLADENS